MRARGVRRGAGPLLALLLLAVSGCSGSGAEPVESEPAAGDECSAYFPAGAEVRNRTLRGASDGEIRAVEFTSADAHTALVLLPERGGGVCGWGTFAHAASAEGFASIVVAPCGYGDSTCTSEGDADPVNEVAPAIDAAREDLGVDRVVLVGASMGGSLTVPAAAGGADVDTRIDVSGPPAWEETTLRSVSSSLPAGDWWSGRGRTARRRTRGHGRWRSVPAPASSTAEAVTDTSC
ncbi:alpha/beta hydrolase [Nocardioides sp. B-3]|uniref:alpha/beta hydrolase n=1 Tax=Nocardioides sp. B-3 TaxID=2895565 RepID=UPI0021522714|nr:alpha/beta hydrolase [Nocardioides sp. B-3]UUZ57843.1 alpha/beta hydrolase [Nocardioides sp. B-3]